MKKFNWGLSFSAFVCGMLLTGSVYSYVGGEYLYSLMLMALFALNAVGFTVEYYREKNKIYTEED